MVGLAKDASHFFKFLLIILLFAICMTVWNFLLAAAIDDTGSAILISAMYACEFFCSWDSGMFAHPDHVHIHSINLFQMAFAGFFVNLSSIPPVLRWLQYVAPLKYALEALTVNEVGAGLMINDELAGAKVQISAEIIMQTLYARRGSCRFATSPIAHPHRLLSSPAGSGSNRRHTTGTFWYCLRSSSALPSSCPRWSCCASANCGEKPARATGGLFSASRYTRGLSCFTMVLLCSACVFILCHPRCRLTYVWQKERFVVFF
jgi:hypothetical protein